ncbi:MAG: hypothetical protein OXC95_13245 [Dehalococcoidia bacterium]|nr:hypothetical protein [Dehalococcoidia bacterium]
MKKYIAAGPVLDRHPLSLAWGDMGSEHSDFVTGIDAAVDDDGLIIYTRDNMILDGWQRYVEFSKRGIEVVLVEYEGDDPGGFVIRRNGNRRHLTPAQRCLAVTEVMRWATESDDGAEVKINAVHVAKMAGASAKTARHVLKADEAGISEVVKQGEMSAKDAASVAVHDDLVGMLKSGDITPAEAVKEVRARRAPSRADNLEAKLGLAERER